MSPEKEAHLILQLQAFKWVVDEKGGWSHPAYGGGFTMIEAIWEEFTDLRERVLAIEANAQAPKVVMNAHSVMGVPVKDSVGYELVKGTQP